MRTTYLDFTSALGYSQRVVTLRAGVVSVVFVLKLSCLFDNELFPGLNELNELCIFPLSCADILRQSTEYNDNVRYCAEIVDKRHIDKGQHSCNYTARYHKGKIQQVVAVSAVHKPS